MVRLKSKKSGGEILSTHLKDTVGEENLPSQNVSLWHEDYFRLFVFKKQKTQEDFPCTSPLTA